MSMHSHNHSLRMGCVHTYVRHVPEASGSLTSMFGSVRRRVALSVVAAIGAVSMQSCDTNDGREMRPPAAKGSVIVQQQVVAPQI